MALDVCDGETALNPWQHLSGSSARAGYPSYLDLPDEELLREVERVAVEFGLPVTSTSN